MVRELLNRSTPPKLCQSPSEMAGRSTPLFPQRWYAMVSYRASAGRRGIVGRISCIARCTLRQDRYVSVASNRVPVPTAFRSVCIVLATAGAFPPAPSLAQAAPRTGDWPAYGHDAGGTRYSPLAEITPGNVARLRVAWVYRTGDYLRDRSRFEAAPLVVDGTLYVSTPLGHVIALDPERGIERWRYDARVSLEGDYGDFANRGVATWLDQTRGTALPCRRRIFLATVDARLIALDARTGRPCGDFGAGGEVDLAGGLRGARRGGGWCGPSRWCPTPWGIAMSRRSRCCSRCGVAARPSPLSRSGRRWDTSSFSTAVPEHRCSQWRSAPSPGATCRGRRHGRPSRFRRRRCGSRPRALRQRTRSARRRTPGDSVATASRRYATTGCSPRPPCAAPSSSPAASAA